MSKKPSAVIIGSGVAGLAIATRLALQGFEVNVYERNAYPGGKLSMFEKDGFRFDAGPSLFTQPDHIEELFEAAGEPIENYFQYKPVSITCKYFFEEGKVINAFADNDLFEEELQQQVAEPAGNLKNYLSASEQLYNDVGSIFLNYSLHKRSTWFHKRIIKALGTVKLSYLFSSFNKYNKKKFSSPEAQQIFNRFATYNGSNPYKAPAMLSLIPHLELNRGVFYPQGGMISITNALYKLAQKKGVHFHFNTGVQYIIHTEGKAKGIVVNNENIAADVVVSNADMYFTWKQLLNRADKARQILKQERSSSALIFYWGINKQFPELDLHNIFFSKNYQQEFATIFAGKKIHPDPTVYVNITAKQETSHAPAGKENWFVMINVPANTGQDWDTLKQQARQYIIDKINRQLNTDIEALIASETVMDPVLIEQQTGSFMGSLYGSSSNTKMAAFKRQPNFTSAIKNLYCCGGTVHPGGGIPLCLKSAAITAAIIQNDQHKKKKQHH
ncbi:MAG: phytoene desaturase [Sphingobacteriales bacterium]|nr:MAG: phytoene desaturase [Sphingobacteriales bacterium]